MADFEPLSFSIDILNDIDSQLNTLETKVHNALKNATSKAKIDVALDTKAIQDQLKGENLQVALKATLDEAALKNQLNRLFDNFESKIRVGVDKKSLEDTRKKIQQELGGITIEGIKVSGVKLDGVTIDSSSLKDAVKDVSAVASATKEATKEEAGLKKAVESTNAALAQGSSASGRVESVKKDREAIEKELSRIEKAIEAAQKRIENAQKPEVSFPSVNKIQGMVYKGAKAGSVNEYIAELKKRIGSQTGKPGHALIGQWLEQAIKDATNGTSAKRAPSAVRRQIYEDARGILGKEPGINAQDAEKRLSKVISHLADLSSKGNKTAGDLLAFANSMQAAVDKVNISKLETEVQSLLTELVKYKSELLDISAQEADAKATEKQTEAVEGNTKAVKEQAEAKEALVKTEKSNEGAQKAETKAIDEQTKAIEAQIKAVKALDEAKALQTIKDKNRKFLHDTSHMSPEAVFVKQQEKIQPKIRQAKEIMSSELDEDSIRDFEARIKKEMREHKSPFTSLVDSIASSTMNDDAREFTQAGAPWAGEIEMVKALAEDYISGIDNIKELERLRDAALSKIADPNSHKKRLVSKGYNPGDEDYRKAELDAASFIGMHSGMQITRLQEAREKRVQAIRELKETDVEYQEATLVLRNSLTPNTEDYKKLQKSLSVWRGRLGEYREAERQIEEIDGELQKIERKFEDFRSTGEIYPKEFMTRKMNGQKGYSEDLANKFMGDMTPDNIAWAAAPFQFGANKGAEDEIKRRREQFLSKNDLGGLIALYEATLNPQSVAYQSVAGSSHAIEGIEAEIKKLKRWQKEYRDVSTKVDKTTRDRAALHGDRDRINSQYGKSGVEGAIREAVMNIGGLQESMKTIDPGEVKEATAATKELTKARERLLEVEEELEKKNKDLKLNEKSIAEYENEIKEIKGKLRFETIEEFEKNKGSLLEKYKRQVEEDLAKEQQELFEKKLPKSGEAFNTLPNSDVYARLRGAKYGLSNLKDDTDWTGVIDDILYGTEDASAQEVQYGLYNRLKQIRGEGWKLADDQKLGVDQAIDDLEAEKSQLEDEEDIQSYEARIEKLKQISKAIADISKWDLNNGYTSNRDKVLESIDEYEAELNGEYIRHEEIKENIGAIEDSKEHIEKLNTQISSLEEEKAKLESLTSSQSQSTEQPQDDTIAKTNKETEATEKLIDAKERLAQIEDELNKIGNDESYYSEMLGNENSLSSYQRMLDGTIAERKKNARKMPLPESDLLKDATVREDILEAGEWMNFGKGKSPDKDSVRDWSRIAQDMLEGEQANLGLAQFLQGIRSMGKDAVLSVDEEINAAIKGLTGGDNGLKDAQARIDVLKQVQQILSDIAKWDDQTKYSENLAKTERYKDPQNILNDLKKQKENLEAERKALMDAEAQKEAAADTGDNSAEVAEIKAEAEATEELTEAIKEKTEAEKQAAEVDSADDDTVKKTYEQIEALEALIKKIKEVEVAFKNLSEENTIHKTKSNQGIFATFTQLKSALNAANVQVGQLDASEVERFKEDVQQAFQGISAEVQRRGSNLARPFVTQFNEIKDGIDQMHMFGKPGAGSGDTQGDMAAMSATFTMYIQNMRAELEELKKSIASDNFNALTARIGKATDAMNELILAFEKFNGTIGADESMKNFMTGLGEIVSNVRLKLSQVMDGAENMQASTALNHWRSNQNIMNEATTQLLESRLRIEEAIKKVAASGGDTEEYRIYRNFIDQKLADIRNFRGVDGNGKVTDNGTRMFISGEAGRFLGSSIKHFASGSKSLLQSAKDYEQASLEIDGALTKIAEAKTRINETKANNDGIINMSDLDTALSRLNTLEQSLKSVSDKTLAAGDVQKAKDEIRQTEQLIAAQNKAISNRRTYIDLLDEADRKIGDARQLSADAQKLGLDTSRIDTLIERMEGVKDDVNNNGMPNLGDQAFANGIKGRFKQANRELEHAINAQRGLNKAAVNQGEREVRALEESARQAVLSLDELERKMQELSDIKVDADAAGLDTTELQKHLDILEARKKIYEELSQAKYITLGDNEEATTSDYNKSTDKVISDRDMQSTVDSTKGELKLIDEARTKTQRNKDAAEKDAQLAYKEINKIDRKIAEMEASAKDGVSLDINTDDVNKAIKELQALRALYDDVRTDKSNITASQVKGLAYAENTTTTAGIAKRALDEQIKAARQAARKSLRQQKTDTLKSDADKDLALKQAYEIKRQIRDYQDMSAKGQGLNLNTTNIDNAIAKLKDLKKEYEDVIAGQGSRTAHAIKIDLDTKKVFDKAADAGKVLKQEIKDTQKPVKTPKAPRVVKEETPEENKANATRELYKIERRKNMVAKVISEGNNMGVDTTALNDYLSKLDSFYNKMKLIIQGVNKESAKEIKKSADYIGVMNGAWNEAGKVKDATRNAKKTEEDVNFAKIQIIDLEQEIDNLKKLSQEGKLLNVDTQDIDDAIASLKTLKMLYEAAAQGRSAWSAKEISKRSDTHRVFTDAKNGKKEFSDQLKNATDVAKNTAEAKTEVVKLETLIERLRSTADKAARYGVDDADLQDKIKDLEKIKDLIQQIADGSSNKSVKAIKGSADYLLATKGATALNTHTNTLIQSAKQNAQVAKSADLLSASELRLKNALGSVTAEAKSQFNIMGELRSAMMQYLSLQGARQFLNNIVEIGGQLEEQRLSIGAILQDTAQANTLFEQVQSLAVKSPFGILELDQYTKQLTAYGFKYSELFDMTKRLADISAGTGTDVSRLTLALGHVKSESALTGYTLRQFAMNNVPMIGELMKMLSERENRVVTASDVRKRVSQKSISYDDVLSVLRGLTDEGGMFHDMQEVMSNSVKSKWKNVKDNMDVMYGQMAESGIGDALKEVAELIARLTRKWEELIVALGAGAAMWGVLKGSIVLYNKSLRGNSLLAAKAIEVSLKQEKETLRLAQSYRNLTSEESKLFSNEKEWEKSHRATLIKESLKSGKMDTEDLLQGIASDAIDKDSAIEAISQAIAEGIQGIDAHTLAIAKNIRTQRLLTRVALGTKKVFMALGSVLKGIVFNPMTWLTAAAAVIGDLLAREAEETKKIEESADNILLRGQEGLKNAQRFMLEHDIKIRYDGKDITNYIEEWMAQNPDKVGKVEFAMPNFDNMTQQDYLDFREEAEDFIRNYSSIPNELLNRAYAEMSNGAIPTLREQFTALAKGVASTVASMAYLNNNIPEYIEIAAKKTDGWLNDSIQSNISDYSDGLQDFNKAVNKLIADYPREVDRMITSMRKNNAEFNKMLLEKEKKGEIFTSREVVEMIAKMPKVMVPSAPANASFMAYLNTGSYSKHIKGYMDYQDTRAQRLGLKVTTSSLILEVLRAIQEPDRLRTYIDELSPIREKYKGESEEEYSYYYHQAVAQRDTLFNNTLKEIGNDFTKIWREVLKYNINARSLIVHKTGAKVNDSGSVEITGAQLLKQVPDMVKSADSNFSASAHYYAGDAHDALLDAQKAYEDVQEAKNVLAEDVKTFAAKMTNMLQASGWKKGTEMSGPMRQAVLTAITDFVAKAENITPDVLNEVVANIATEIGIKIDVEEKEAVGKISAVQRALNALIGKDWVVKLGIKGDFGEDLGQIDKIHKEAYSAMKDLIERDQTNMFKGMKPGDPLPFHLAPTVSAPETPLTTQMKNMGLPGYANTPWGQAQIKIANDKMVGENVNLVQDVAREYNEFQNAYEKTIEYYKAHGIAAPTMNDGKGTSNGGGYKGEFEREWTERIRILKEAYDWHQKWSDEYSKNDAMDRVVERYGTVFDEWRDHPNPGLRFDVDVHEIENYLAYVKKIEGEMMGLYHKQKHDKSKNFGKDALEAWRQATALRMDAEWDVARKKSEEWAATWSHNMDVMTEKFEIFSEVLAVTDNLFSARRISGLEEGKRGVNIADLVKSVIEGKLKEVGLDINFAEVLTSDDKSIDNMVKDLFKRRGEDDKAMIDGIVESLTKWRDLQKDVYKTAVKTAMELKNTGKSYNDEIRKIDAEREVKLNEIAPLKEVAPEAYEEARRRIDGLAEQKLVALEPRIINFLNNAQSLTEKTASSMVDYMRFVYLDQHKNGLLSSSEYADKVKEMTEIYYNVSRNGGKSLYDRMGAWGGMSFARHTDTNRNDMLSQIRQEAVNKEYAVSEYGKTGQDKAVIAMAYNRLILALQHSVLGQGGRGEVRVASDLGKILQELLANGMTNEIRGKLQGFINLDADMDENGKPKKTNEKTPFDKATDSLRRSLEDFSEALDVAVKSLSFLQDAASNIFGSDSGIARTLGEGVTLGSSISSGMQAGAAFGPWGKAAGAAIGAISGVFKIREDRIKRSIDNLRKETEKIRQNTEVIKRLREDTLGYDFGEKANNMATMYKKQGSELANNIAKQYKTRGNTGYGQEYANMQEERANLVKEYELQNKLKNKSESDIEQIEQRIAELDEAMLNYTQNLASELWGIDLKGWSQQLSDALCTAFENGQNAATAFKTTVQDILRQVVRNMMDLAVIQPILQRTEKDLFGYVDSEGKKHDGIIDINDPAASADKVADYLTTAFGKDGYVAQAVDAGQQMFDGIEASLNDEGLSLTSTNQETLGNGIQGTSEETSNLLAGYVNALRQDVSVNRMILERFTSEYWQGYITQVTDMQGHLNNIDKNVAAIYSLMNEQGAIYRVMDSIDRRLERFSNGTDQMYIG